MLLNSLIYRVKQYINNEKGSGVVEIAIIIVILIVLALLFQTEITAALHTIIDKITTQIEGIS
ncbi:MAG: Flp1 family type IVb pilin [Vallitaleaceae bacterium]|jgi:Flp pilus assembly pilin Flp|nr:Flp1 family type IVb pilin [Vallitaleaceae bacterium]